MSDNQAFVDDAATLIVDHAPQSVGRSLRQAREARALPLPDLARSLKLSERQLQALEADQWSELPGPTFVRGFVRNYARLLALDAEPLMQMLDQQLEKPRAKLDIPASAPTAPMAGASKKNDRSVILLGLFLLLVAVLGYLLLPGDWGVLQSRVQDLLAGTPAQSASTAQEKTHEPLYPPGANNQELIAPVGEGAAEHEGEPVPEQKAEQPNVPPGESPVKTLPIGTVPVDAAPASNAATVTAATLDTVPGAAALTPVANATLRFVVSKEAWIEVRDQEQKVLFSQRVAPGGEPQVQGRGPLAVTVGYAPGVQVFLRGKAIDLAPHSRGDVARLVLE
ncbi:RodZ domain-containing protein [Azonexus sp.]|uniref:RodZ domain-containing protein n=1 Tax=Azonexus sp. TaxID=1872668 RepID=UPI0039E51AE7